MGLSASVLDDGERVSRSAIRQISTLSVVLSCAMVCASIATKPAIAGCQLNRFTEMPISMTGLRALTTVNINGIDVQMAVDSGAFYSTISQASASQLQLKTHSAFGLYVTGIGNGRAEVSVASVKTLTLPGLHLHDTDLLVGGSEAGAGGIGFLGANILQLNDAEYDLGHGAIRLFEAKDCDHAVLAYWAGNTTPYSTLPLIAETNFSWSTLGTRIQPKLPPWMYTNIARAYVNGTEIRVEFDTGATTSVLSAKAAAKVGVTTDSPGVTNGGESYGIGSNSFPTFIANFPSFKIGQEEIKNAKLRVGDIDLPYADMLIGADFFLSHRIYVANSQHKLYFTYNGGPVFDLSAKRRESADTAVADASSANSGTSQPVAGESSASGESQRVSAGAGSAAEATEHARLGEALASRRQFDQALTELNRACDLSPDNAEYFHRRGLVYWQLRQGSSAMTDFDRALQLKPDDLPSLLSRAALKLQQGDMPGARADLDTADRIAPKQSDVRYRLAESYEFGGFPAPAVAQFSLWIDSHADDARLPAALNGRCWSRATAGIELALALKDCNDAIKLTDKSNPLHAATLNSRGFVLLRMGEYDRSIADYNASLKLNPKDADSLYCRGIDKLRKQKAVEGKADMDAATALSSGVADRFKDLGIVP